MIELPKQVKGITHPLIKSVYLKKEFKTQSKILVIEIRKRLKKGLGDVLEDLDLITASIANKFGSFDRVDIRTA